eukprot:CAMPEP_0180684482 /NCGR_PEP_ID=MMETSP1037_2-20121125/71825_1 /TAXON_ID=632150 /ORGANISM="Azadinium spinosum, Strain 3D9" /LENGTH=128 /DNA_ID=CAMNT_0022714967 /DNA_START=304 /DNA_END=689 /DNA_ORIENTATION=+
MSAVDLIQLFGGVDIATQLGPTLVYAQNLNRALWLQLVQRCQTVLGRSSHGGPVHVKQTWSQSVDWDGPAMMSTFGSHRWALCELCEVTRQAAKAAKMTQRSLDIRKAATSERAKARDALEPLQTVIE